MRLHLITVGEPRLAYARAGWDEYATRLRRYHKLQVSRVSGKTQAAESEAVRRADGPPDRSYAVRHRSDDRRHGQGRRADGPRETHRPSQVRGDDRASATQRAAILHLVVVAVEGRQHPRLVNRPQPLRRLPSSPRPSVARRCGSARWRTTSTATCSSGPPSNCRRGPHARWGNLTSNTHVLRGR